MTKRQECDCERSGSFPLFCEPFSRRQFLRVAGTGLVASYFAPVLSAKLLESANGVSPALHNTARNCIFIFLSGAPSQIDTWDLKEGAWTPKDFAPTDFGPVRFPQGLMPNTASQLGTIAIVRSGLSWAAFSEQSKALVDSPDLNPLFSYAADEYARYGSTDFGASLIIARNLLGARRGTRFVQVTLDGWDNHFNIYAKSGTSLYSQMKI